MREPSRRPRGPATRRRATVAICLVFMLLIAGAFAAVLAFSRTDRFREAQENTARDAFEVARNLNFIVQTANLVLESESPFAARLIATPPDLASDRAARNHLDAVRKRWPFLRAALVVTADGTARAATEDGAGLADALLQDYRDTVAANLPDGTILGQRTRDGGNAIVMLRHLSEPAASAGPAGAIVGAIDLRYVASVYREMHLPQNVVLTIFRADDLTPLVSEPPIFQTSQPLVQDTAELRRALASAPAGTLTESSMADGSTQILSYHKLDENGLFAAVSLPRSAVRLFWRGDLLTASILAALAMAALLTVTYSVLHHLRFEQQSKDHLEERVRERTAELETLNRQLETLFREVHHRVKNNLQIITSLLSLQSARLSVGPARDALQDSINRVYSMSLVHEMLYSERETTSIDCSVYLGTLARRIGEAFETEDRVSVDVSGDPLILGLNAAIPLALISNEIISNALKHAFPAGRHGRLAISVRTDADHMVLTIADDGIGYPWRQDWERNTGVGLKILQALTRQIEGQATFENRDGTVFRLRFPMEEARAA